MQVKSILKLVKTDKLYPKGALASYIFNLYAMYLIHNFFLPSLGKLSKINYGTDNQVQALFEFYFINFIQFAIGRHTLSCLNKLASLLWILFPIF